MEHPLNTMHIWTTTNSAYVMLCETLIFDFWPWDSIGSKKCSGWNGILMQKNKSFVPTLVL